MARLFISQARIDKLTADDRVVLDGDRLELPALGATFKLHPAVHFLRLVSDEGDPHGLIGRVKTEEQLKKLGAELLATSVLLGETAYDCENESPSVHLTPNSRRERNTHPLRGAARQPHLTLANHFTTTDAPSADRSAT